MATTDWTSIAIASLRADFPRLPDPLPDAVAALVPVVAARMEAAQPGVAAMLIGGAQVTYAGAGDLLTPAERAVLRRWARPRYVSVRTVATTDAPTTVGADQADYEGRWDAL